MKKIFAVTLLLCGLLCQSIGSSHHNHVNSQFEIKTIVIDAGHGGHDSGCLGSFAKEKNVTLAVALKLGERIQKNFPKVKVIYTRKTDEFIELFERADIANRNNADLFISIHCNANDNKAAYGTESWVMGLHKSNANLEVAKRENSVILLEDNYAQNYNGFDPNSPESYIMFSLNQNAHLDQSLDVAAKVEDEFRNDGRSSRGVKQAGYLVLWRTTMPSLLIETGFLTNNTEEKYLTSEDGQNKIAQSVFDAVAKYKKEVEGTESGSSVTEEVNKDTPVIVVRQPDMDKDVKILNNEKQLTDTPKVVSPNQLIYKIQIAAGANMAGKNDPKYKGISDLSYEKNENGLYRYLVGNYTDLSAAEGRLEELKDKGFKAAFIATYKNGKRVQR